MARGRLVLEGAVGSAGEMRRFPLRTHIERFLRPTIS